MKKNFLNKRIYWAFFGLLLCVSILGTGAYENMQQVKKQSKEVSAYIDELISFERIESNIRSLDSGKLNYLSNPHQDELKPYYLGLAGLKRITDKLKTNPCNKEGYQKSVLLALTNLIEKKSSLSIAAVEHKRFNRNDSITGSVQLKESKLLTDSIKAKIAILQVNDRFLLMNSFEVRQKQAEKLYNRFIILAFLFLIVIGVAYYYIKKDIEKIIKDEQHLKFNASLIRNISDPIITTDAANKITNWNVYAQELFGHTETEVLGKELNTVLQSSSNSESLLQIEDLSSDTDFWKGELTFCHKNGEKIYTELTVSAIINENGEKSGTVSVIRNITLRKIAQEKLHLLTTNLEEEVKLKAAELNNVFERITDAFIALDNDWNYTYVNKKAAELHEKSIAELIGKNIWTEFPDVANEPFYDALKKAKDTNEPQRVELYYSKTGNWYEDLIYPSPDGISVYYHDISLRKKIQRELEDTESKFRGLVEQSMVGVYIIQDNKLVYANPRMLELTGYTEAEVIDKMTVFDFVFPDDRNIVLKHIENSIQTGSNTMNYELRLVKKNDAVFHAEVFGTLTQYLGKTAIIGTMVDISVRIDTQQDLVESEEKYRTLIEQASDAIFISDLTGGYMDVNANAEKLSGYSKEELTKLTFYDLMAEGERENNPVKIDELLQGKVVINERLMKRKDGKYLEIEISAKILGDGRLLGIVRDISARKKAEETLKASEQKYRLLFTQNPMPMWMISLEEKKFLDVNNAAIDFYGYSRDEFLKMTAYDIRPKVEVKRLKEYKADTNSEVQYAGIWKHLKKDGSIAKVNIITHLIDYEGIKAKLVLSNDVTEKLKAEKELKQSHEQLRQLASHLENIRESERTHIAREIHDELGQQLTGLKMDITWLKRKLNTNEPDILNKLNETIQLVNETVVTVRRIATSLRPSILDDLGLVAAMEWQSDEFGKRAEIMCNFNSDVTTTNIKAALSTGIFRIYQECLTNIFRHADATEVNASLIESNDTLTLTVTDNGNGFKLSEKENRKTLGLLGMKERTGIMGGTCEIKSIEGKGTSVIIIVPSTD